MTTAQEVQRLAADAFDAGERPRLDSLQAQAEVDAARAAIPPLQARSDNLLHTLAILLGRFPEQFGAQDLRPKAQGKHSDSSRSHHIAIPLDFGLNTSTLHQAFTIASLAWTARVTGGQTLYSGGRLVATVDAARARTAAARLTYQQTDLKAFQEVEDTLADDAAAQQCGFR